MDKKYSFSSDLKKEWFNSHIEPSYQQLCEIHDDYTKQFTIAVDSLEKEMNLKLVLKF